jgi:two-component system, response regulator RegA
MTEVSLPLDKTLLLVDDDKPFLTRLARAMETRGFEVRMQAGPMRALWC